MFTLLSFTAIQNKQKIKKLKALQQFLYKNYNNKNTIIIPDLTQFACAATEHLSLDV